MLATAKTHFDNDIDRAVSLCAHGQQLPVGLLKDDVLRASWMMAIGALDAYFCDAYADLIARTLRAKQLEPTVEITERLANLKVPVIAIIRPTQGNWRWRMAARELIEDQSVLSLEEIRKLFSHFFRKPHRLLKATTIEPWILHKESKMRRFGITPTQYRATATQNIAKIREEALDTFEEYYDGIFQRRHDCIHNCDRPKHALQSISDTAVTKIIEDVVFLVNRCHEAFLSEFPYYLKNLGFSAIVRNQVTQ